MVKLACCEIERRFVEYRFPISPSKQNRTRPILKQFAKYRCKVNSFVLCNIETTTIFKFELHNSVMVYFLRNEQICVLAESELFHQRLLTAKRCCRCFL